MEVSQAEGASCVDYNGECSDISDRSELGNISRGAWNPTEKQIHVNQIRSRPDIYEVRISKPRKHKRRSRPASPRWSPCVAAGGGHFARPVNASTKENIPRPISASSWASTTTHHYAKTGSVRPCKPQINQITKGGWDKLLKKQARTLGIEGKEESKKHIINLICFSRTNCGQGWQC